MAVAARVAAAAASVAAAAGAVALAVAAVDLAAAAGALAAAVAVVVLGAAAAAGFDPAAAMQMRVDNMRTPLGDDGDANNDVWKVLSGKIQKVLQDQADIQAGTPRGGFGAGGRGGRGGGRGGRGGGAGGGGFGGGGGGGGFGGGGGPGGAAAPAAPSTNPLVNANTDLNTLVSASQPAAETDIKTKLQAVRDARSKLEKQLQTDQADLKGVTNVRQEAYLVSQGILD